MNLCVRDISKHLLASIAISLSYLLREVNLYAHRPLLILSDSDMISVIIPTFNRSGLLREAVLSVLAQKKVPGGFETIVVDDGSYEDIRAALADLPGDIRLIRQEHSGVSAARNRGISEARGEWIAFLDSDDLWLPGKLSAQMQFFSSHPDVLICQTEEVWIRNGEHLNPRKYHKQPEGHCFPLLLERCLVSPSAVVVHRTLFDIVGLFDESLPACEDYDLWLRIGCRFPIGLVHQKLVKKHGGHSDQLSATVPALDRYRILSIVKLLRTGALDDAQAEAAKRVLQAKTRIYVKGSRNRGNIDEAAAIERLAAEVMLIPSPQIPSP